MKKLHFFKNDLFDIKYKIWHKRINSMRIQSIKLRTRALFTCLKIMIMIGHPLDEEEYETLECIIQKYDKDIQELEEHVVSRAREYIEYHKTIMNDMDMIVKEKKD